MTDENLNNKNEKVTPAETNEAVGGGNPVPPTPEAEDDSWKDELFGDIMNETPEEIKAERDTLRQQIIDMGKFLTQAAEKEAKLRAALDDEKTETQKALERQQRQFDSQKELAIKGFIKDMLTVVDTLELGLSFVTEEQRVQDPKYAKHVDGVEKTLKKLTDIFNRHGVVAVNPARGDAFNENVHEPVIMDEEADVPSDTIVKVETKGYTLNGHLLRPARVIVRA